MKRFKGGRRFDNFEGAAEPILRECPPPPEVAFPRTFRGHTWEAAVAAGATVRAGEPLLRLPGSPHVLPAPVGGTVTVTGDAVRVAGGTATVTGTIRVTAADRSKAEVPSSIKPDDRQSLPVAGHTRAPWHLDREGLFALFAGTGCSLLLDDLFADAPDTNRIDTVIVNAVHTTPLDLAWSPALLDDPGVVGDGLGVLAALFPQARIVAACTAPHARWFEERIAEQASLAVLSDRYPQEYPELLARDAAGRRLTAPDGTRDRGILFVPIMTLVRIAETLTRGRSLTDIILPVAGPGISRPGWYRIPLGTPVSHLMAVLGKDPAAGPWRVIFGDVFTGAGKDSADASILPGHRAVSVIREEGQRELWRFLNPGVDYDTYPGAAVASVLRFIPRRLDAGRHGGARPCVQCGYCDQVCPAGIIPHLIWRHVEAGDAAASFRHRPYDCIDCRLCDYVCPSKIDISAGIRKATDAYHDEGREATSNREAASNRTEAEHESR